MWSSSGCVVVPLSAMDGGGRWTGDRMCGSRAITGDRPCGADLGSALTSSRPRGSNMDHAGRICCTHLFSPGGDGCYATMLGTALLICRWCACHFLLRWRFWTSFVVARQRMTAWGHVCPHRRIKVAVIGFLLRQDEDLMDACPSWSSQSVEFRRLHRRTPLGDSCMEISGLDRIRLYVTIFFPTIWFEEKSAWSSATCCHRGTRLSGREWYGSQVLMTSFHGLRLYIDGKLALCFRLHSSGMRVVASSLKKFNVLTFRWKFMGWT
jgi:hypothetical protein